MNHRTVLAKNFDLVFTIYNIKKCLPIKVNIHHVKSHQDKEKDIDHLTIWEIINLEADSIAKAHLEEHLVLPTTVPRQIADEAWILLVQGKKITENPGRSITEAIHSPIIHNYYITNRQYTSQALIHINWSALGEALEKQPHLFQMWLAKHVHHHCTTRVANF